MFIVLDEIVGVILESNRLLCIAQDEIVGVILELLFLGVKLVVMFVVLDEIVGVSNS